MIDCFSNIHYTPAWYWKKFPGFFNVESYRILAAWDKGVRTEEEIARQNALETGELIVKEEKEEKEEWGVEEEKEDCCMEEGSTTKKRKV